MFNDPQEFNAKLDLGHYALIASFTGPKTGTVHISNGMRLDRVIPYREKTSDRRLAVRRIRLSPSILAKQEEAAVR